MKRKLIRYRLIEEHMRAVRSGRYEYARHLLALIKDGRLRVGLNNDAGFAAECFAEKAGCHVGYNRYYSVATVSF